MNWSLFDPRIFLILKRKLTALHKNLPLQKTLLEPAGLLFPTLPAHLEPQKPDCSLMVYRHCVCLQVLRKQARHMISNPNRLTQHNPYNNCVTSTKDQKFHAQQSTQALIPKGKPHYLLTHVICIHRNAAYQWGNKHLVDTLTKPLPISHMWNTKAKTQGPSMNPWPIASCHCPWKVSIPGQCDSVLRKSYDWLVVTSWEWPSLLLPRMPFLNHSYGSLDTTAGIMQNISQLYQHAIQGSNSSLKINHRTALFISFITWV